MSKPKSTGETLQELYEALPVKDGLAAQRTVMAAERTLLAYVRTGFGLFAAGLASARWLGGPMVTAGLVLSATGAIVLAYGWRRFAKSRTATIAMMKRLVLSNREA